jgi:hypothetical protein
MVDTVDTGREEVDTVEVEEVAEDRVAMFNAEATEVVIEALIEEVITKVAAALDITTTLIRVVKTTMSINSPKPNPSSSSLLQIMSQKMISLPLRVRSISRQTSMMSL